MKFRFVVLVLGLALASIQPSFANGGLPTFLDADSGSWLRVEQFNDGSLEILVISDYDFIVLNCDRVRGTNQFDCVEADRDTAVVVYLGRSNRAGSDFWLFVNEEVFYHYN